MGRPEPGPGSDKIEVLVSRVGFQYPSGRSWLHVHFRHVPFPEDVVAPDHAAVLGGLSSKASTFASGVLKTTAPQGSPGRFRLF